MKTDTPYVVYTETGTNTHHYFKTYAEAATYVIKNGIIRAKIAKLLAYTEMNLIKLTELGYGI